MRRLAALAAFCGLLTGTAAAQIGLPADKGLPVVVRAGIAFADVASFDENAGTFEATVDVRVVWEDLRLRLRPENALDPPLVYRGDAATERLLGLWTPPVVLANQVGEASHREIALRTYPDGRAELMMRTTAVFSTPFEVARFPFDRQKLQVELAIRDEPASSVALQAHQADLDFSRVAADAALDGWTLGQVDVVSDPMSGWYGASHARLVASLSATREPGGQVAAILIPLFASLLIPLLAIWLNRVEDGVFQVETFELVNLIIGGLFAVIALNFTINADYGVLATGGNAVNRLFTLNYLTLGAALAINILFFRYRVFEGLFGRYVQEQLYLALTWAVPAIVLTSAAAILLAAMA